MKFIVHKNPNPTHGSGWIGQVQPTTAVTRRLGNPTHGNGWIVQVQPSPQSAGIRSDLNSPLTAVSGIQKGETYLCRPDLNDPSTAVGGI